MLELKDIFFRCAIYICKPKQMKANNKLKQKKAPFYKYSNLKNIFLDFHSGISGTQPTHTSPRRRSYRMGEKNQVTLSKTFPRRTQSMELVI